MASPTTQMKLPAARAGQIKILAQARGLGITETIEFLLNLAIEAGELPDMLPGYKVVLDGGLVVLHLEGHRLPGLTPGAACSIADEFEYAGTEQTVGKGRPRFYGADGGFAEGCNYGLIIGRHGAGVVVGFDEYVVNEGAIPEKRIRVAMTRRMAVDLARQIRAVAQPH